MNRTPLTLGILTLGLSLLGGLWVFYYAFAFRSITANESRGTAPIRPLVALLHDDLSVIRGARKPPIDVNEAVKSTPEKLKRGGELYTQLCASCHGAEGKGDGLAGAALARKPRNFHQTGGWVNGSKVSQIYRTLINGIVTSGMASYDYLPPEDLFALTAYVRHWNAQHPNDAAVDLEALNRDFKLAEGVQEPSQISLGSAQAAIEKNFASAYGEKVSTALRRYRESAPPQIRSAVFDPERLILALTRDGARSLASPSQFVAFISASPLQKGVRAEALTYSSAEWQSLYGYFRGLM